MKLADLQPRQGRVDIEVTVTDLKPARAISKPGFSGKVADATISDGESTMVLTLWNDDCEKVKQGDRIRITNGYVNEFRGERQLGAGKYGKIEKL